MNKIEQHIWDYLDGTCSEQEKMQIAELIDKNPAYQTAYNELKNLHAELKNIELDEPSMAFTRNVMNQVNILPVPGSIRSLVDKRIIYGIGGFFLLAILILLAFAFSMVDWTRPADAAIATFNLPQVYFSPSLNSTLIRSFIFADLIVGLYFLDSILRKKIMPGK